MRPLYAVVVRVTGPTLVAAGCSNSDSGSNSGGGGDG